MITRDASLTALELQTAIALGNHEAITGLMAKLIHEMGGSPVTVLNSSTAGNLLYLMALIVRAMPTAPARHEGEFKFGEPGTDGARHLELVRTPDAEPPKPT